MAIGVADVLSLAAGVVRGATPPARSPAVESTARWDCSRAASWYESTGWLAGCNFIPSTAGNQLEMWQEETYDPATIDRELGWAAGLGFNSVRVFLHDLLWAGEGEAFLDRVDDFLSIAQRRGISTMLVLFDGVWNPDPRAGRQSSPRPGVHNAMWVQSPGAAVLSDRSRWGMLGEYVDAVIGKFGRDARVVAWDLFNEPDNPNLIAYPRREVAHKSATVTDLVEVTFDRAAALDPIQPLTCGVFLGVGGATERVSRLNRVMLGRSDVISFHSYWRRATLHAAIDHLSAYRRPLLCTEWLGRPLSPVELIGDLADRRVGAYCWGLVDGRSQTRYPWTSWLRPGREPRVWFHDLLHSDGTPYAQHEVELIRRVCGANGARGPATPGS